MEELVRNGIDYFCISPGSRSTPLTTAVARNSRTRSIVCIDERAAAFHALGYARATGHPAVLICTSGTAVANYLPAVVEASVDCIPLIILSADRPPELRQTRANQTINQPHIFGSYVRWEFDMPCPDAQVSPSFVLTTADYAIAISRSPVPGPVHLNCMFREPLLPGEHSDTESEYLATWKNNTASARHWSESSSPYTQYEQPQWTAPEPAVKHTASALASARQSLIVVGRLDHKAERQAVEHLITSTGALACADISSGLRLHAKGISLPFIDQALLSAELRASLQPDVVLYIGGQITSKRLQQFLDARGASGETYITAKSHPFRQDPSHAGGYHLHCDIALFCTAVAAHIAEPHAMLPIYRAITHATEQRIAAWLRAQPQISEIGVVHDISTRIPASHALFLSNSMPIRDMDMYAAATGARVPIGVNRGASGIDGIIATACGFAVGLARPTTLVIGDLALLHDVNSLVLAARNAQPLIIVAINNSGGGIFSFLPIAQHTDVFEPYFGTPQQFSIAHAAAFAGLAYAQPQSPREFSDVYTTAVQQQKSIVIEVQTHRQSNIAQHRELQALIAADISALCKL